MKSRKVQKYQKLQNILHSDVVFKTTPSSFRKEGIRGICRWNKFSLIYKHKRCQK